MYDCGYVFTLDLNSGERRDHGKVWRDDHRCNYGPTAFAGADGTVTVYDPETGKTGKADGPVPPPAGPAVDTEEDAWYFADKEVTRYALALSPESVPLVSGGK